MISLSGKTVLITGASKGIGKSIAQKFAELGANVAFTYLSSVEKGEALEKELSGGGAKVKGYRSDASKFSDAEKLVNDVVTEFGTIDILVNNAGITADNLLMRMSEEQWDSVINTNLKSVFNMSKSVLKPMMKQKHGSIINISSVVGINGNAGQANYSASKGGMNSFTKSLARELGSRNIRCNAIAPGFIETEMTEKLNPEVVASWLQTIPLRRAGKPEDVANMAAFLGSDLSSYVSGQVFNVCGGMLT